MPIVLNGTTGITTPTYNGSTTAEYLVPVTGFKNRIINGDMTIDQRNAGAAVTVNGGTQFGVDRFFGEDDTDGAFTLQQSTVAPAGFTNSLLATITTADTSLGSTQLAIIGHRIEGFNVADLGWGTANASAVTLSFWVRSSLTGTFGGALWNSAGDRSYPYSYTISAANTWEQKSVTIAGDTIGTWLTNNGRGINISWSLGVGSNFQATAGSWAGALELAPTGATSVIGTNGATFYITGVQLEKGNNATSFDYLPYGTELLLCQRYYQKSFPVATAPVQNSGIYTLKWTQLKSGYGTRIFIPFIVSMRGTPTITGFNGGNTNNLVRNVPAATDITVIAFEEISAASFCLVEYGGSGDNTGDPVGWNWTASAEL